MTQIQLKRILNSDSGTLGILYIDGVQYCKTLELPWRDNARSISCIPAGVYACKKGHMSSHNVDHYELEDVTGRSAIFIHAGNFAGDTAKGLRTHVQGCILLGKDFDLIEGQLGLTVSRPTVLELEKLLEFQPFQLIIV